MPRTDVLFYQDDKSSVPVLEWLDSLPRKVQNKCYVRIERLEELGHELRRPESDLVEQGIHELRIRFQSVNYRMLYAFHEKAAVLLHGLTKEKEIGAGDLKIALSRLNEFRKDPNMYTYSEVVPERAR
jgi:phage-related protein